MLMFKVSWAVFTGREERVLDTNLSAFWNFEKRRSTGLIHNVFPQANINYQEFSVNGIPCGVEWVGSVDPYDGWNSGCGQWWVEWRVVGVTVILWLLMSWVEGK